MKIHLLLDILPRYLALEGLCSMANLEFSADAVRKHQETVVSALKVFQLVHATGELVLCTSTFFCCSKYLVAFHIQYTVQYTVQYLKLQCHGVESAFSVLNHVLLL